MIVEVRRGERGLELALAGQSRGASIDIDEIRRRLKQGTRLALARACGAVDGASILDAMSGLGVDGITLACLGAEVTMVEREHATFSVLADGVARACRELAPRGSAECMHCDAGEVLDGSRQFDVVYLDPMFPERRKKALPRLRSQVLGAAATTDADLLVLLIAARRAARSRVVVKRRARDPAVAPPDWSIRGRSVRFDVYSTTTPRSSDARRAAT